ncbi:MAG TPA: hypothetical protein DD640_05680 [Clostridiales bacterium]|nr:hypothetical protein [Clostridiales bacterium]
MNGIWTDIFLQVLNMSITATYVMLFVCILRLLLKKVPKFFSYALWSVVLLRLVCPFSFSSAFSLLNALKRWDIPASPGGLDFVSSSTQTITGASAPTSGSLTPTAETIAGALPVVPDQVQGAAWLPDAAAALWMTGFVVLFIYTVVSFIRLKMRMADATRIRGRIYETDTVTTPFVFGLIRPRIILPVGISPADSTYVLHHEQAHIRRKDYLIKPLAFMVLAVHWFNPFIWLAYILMSQDMEMSCDERVLKELGHDVRLEYGSALLRFSAQRRILARSPLAFGESSTKSRVRNIMNYRKPAFWITLAIVVIAVLASVCLLANPINDQLDLEPSTYDSSRQSGQIGLTVKDIVITPETQNVTLLMENESDSPVMYGEFVILEVKIGQDWFTIPTRKGVNWKALAYALEPHAQVEIVFPLSYFYEQPAPGEYRFIEWIGVPDPELGQESYAIAEFKIISDEVTDDYPQISIQVNISGVGISSLEATKNSEKQIIQTAILEHAAHSSAWPGASIEYLPDKIRIWIKQTQQDPSYAEYAVIIDEAGRPCLLSGQDNQYSLISDEVYQPLLDIARQGFFEDPRLIVKSGANSFQALGHWTYSYNKIQKLNADSIHLPAQGVAAYIQYLPLDFTSESNGGYLPFAMYKGNKKVNGTYTLYDESFHEIAIEEIRQLEPGKYMVKLEVSFETLLNETGYQYFFGVIVPGG